MLVYQSVYALEFCIGYEYTMGSQVFSWFTGLEYESRIIYERWVDASYHLKCSEWVQTVKYSEHHNRSSRLVDLFNSSPFKHDDWWLEDSSDPFFFGWACHLILLYLDLSWAYSTTLPPKKKWTEVEFMEQLVDHMSNKLYKQTSRWTFWNLWGVDFLGGKCGIAGVPLGSHENIENTAQVPSIEFQHLLMQSLMTPHHFDRKPDDSPKIDTVDGSEITNNHLECIKPCKQWNKLPTSTGDHRISEPSTVFPPNERRPQIPKRIHDGSHVFGRRFFKPT